MSPPIMSRFDLFFVLLDQCDENFDMSLAEHIVTLHKNEANSSSMFNQNTTMPDVFTSEQLQKYIRLARSIRPQVFVFFFCVHFICLHVI